MGWTKKISDQLAQTMTQYSVPTSQKGLGMSQTRHKHVANKKTTETQEWIKHTNQ